MGICLGMQLLFDSSEEFGETKGLGLIPGKVKKIDASDDNVKLKVPNIGWCRTQFRGEDRHAYLNQELPELPHFYYVHSYYADMDKEENCLASIEYGDQVLPSIVGTKNVIGCQFHPEKSGPYGLKLLKNFLEKKDH